MNDMHVVENLFALLDESGKPVELDENGQIQPTLSGDLIPLKEWAIRNGIAPATARQKALRGSLRTARKVGRDWMISESELNTDHRMRLTAAEHPALEGPFMVKNVLNYLMALSSTTLPDRWAKDNSHQTYCKKVFLRLRESMRGNPQALFDLLCDAMGREPDAPVYFISHRTIMEHIDDEAWHTTSNDSEAASGITIDFSDYLIVLHNIIKDLLAYSIDLKIHHDQQELFMPWYHSMVTSKAPDDGLYFIPSQFFKAIFFGLDITV